MARFKAMSGEDFNRFRVFFVSKKCPFAGNMAGPSGLYSSKVPTLDLLLSGKYLPPEFTGFLGLHEFSYPVMERHARQSTIAAAGQSKSVLDAIHQLGDPECLAADFARLQQSLAAFRRGHMQLVVKFIPEVVTNASEGTGGEGIELLRERSAMHRRAIRGCPFHALRDLIQRFRGGYGQ